MAAANVSSGPKTGSGKSGKSAAGKPHPQTTAPAKPHGKPGRGRHSGGSKKK